MDIHDVTHDGYSSAPIDWSRQVYGATISSNGHCRLCALHVSCCAYFDSIKRHQSTRHQRSQSAYYRQCEGLESALGALDTCSDSQWYVKRKLICIEGHDLLKGPKTTDLFISHCSRDRLLHLPRNSGVSCVTSPVPSKS